MSDLYKKSGVDINKGNDFVRNINTHMQETKQPGSSFFLKDFSAFFDLSVLKETEPVLVTSTDGVGTKLILASEYENFETIGFDLVAMCANDICVHGARPLFFLDYIACSKLDPQSANIIIRSISKACQHIECALIGGETAEMPGLYKKGHYDLAGFCVGVVDKQKILPKRQIIKPGDAILGIKSSGLHSNGYSLIRKIIKDKKIDLLMPCPWEKDSTLLSKIMCPTSLYGPLVLNILIKFQDSIKGMSHITGGGFFENIPRCLPEELSACIEKKQISFSPLFSWVQKLGKISCEEMLKTFNCGVGYTLVVDKMDEKKILNTHSKDGVFHLGYVVQTSTQRVSFV